MSLSVVPTMTAREAASAYHLSHATYYPGAAGGKPAVLPWAEARERHAADTARLWALVERGFFTKAEALSLAWPAIELPR